MLSEGIIEPAVGPWAAPVVIVQKPCGEPQFCVDYRGLNQLTVKDSYPLPRVDESLDFLSRGKFLTTIDLSRGYWQVPMAESSKPKAAFASHCGLFQFRVLPFGLCNAPATFQRLMNSVLAGLIYKSCAVYLDDIVVASPTFEQHIEDLKDVFLRLRSAGLTMKLAKCQFCRKEMKFLGYRVCPDGILPDQEKVSAVLNFETPKNVRQVRQFLGLSGYYIRFIQDYARHAEPLKLCCNTTMIIQHVIWE
ncbi:retrovirus-related Pol polyprotein from transposon 297 [Danio aesculapii]|uniref:retrovirus-related Pol polyprotein from transposon 297 n=1 Tax=Danio aesculapii TaxID=1142201 RepID=UPI0024C0806A|nr:retrovirus-related Pol polyprotein from transposon 297 [Danio aesculapii]